MQPKLEEIVAALRAGGQDHGQGYFTVDQGAAYAKMHGFQLADEADSLARLAELVARLKGWLVVLPSHQGLTVLLPRVHFARVEAEGAMHVSITTPRTQREAALQDLTLAMRAMAARARGVINLVSNDGKGPYRCNFDGVSRGKIQALSGGPRVTSIHLPLRRLALPLGWANPWGLDEVTRLRSRVRWSRTDIKYGNKVLSFGLPTHLAATCRDSIDDAEMVFGVDWAHLRPGEDPEIPRWSGGDDESPMERAAERYWLRTAKAAVDELYTRYDSLADAGTLHILLRGVHVERIPLETLPAGVVAVLDVGDAKRDLGENRLVRTELFERRVGELVRRIEGELPDKARERAGAIENARGDTARREKAALAQIIEAMSSAGH